MTDNMEVQNSVSELIKLLMFENAALKTDGKLKVENIPEKVKKKIQLLSLGFEPLERNAECQLFDSFFSSNFHQSSYSQGTMEVK